jgi:hypothetical protein
MRAQLLDLGKPQRRSMAVSVGKEQIAEGADSGFLFCTMARLDRRICFIRGLYEMASTENSRSLHLCFHSTARLYSSQAEQKPQSSIQN